MIVILFALIGAVWGGYLAKRRNGNRLDIAQYAAGLAILCAVVGMFVTIFVDRALL